MRSKELKRAIKTFRASYGYDRNVNRLNPYGAFKLSEFNIENVRNLLLKEFGTDLLLINKIPILVFKRKFSAITLHSLGVSVSDISKILKKSGAAVYNMLEDYKDPDYEKIKREHNNLTYDFINYFLENNIRFKQPLQ